MQTVQLLYAQESVKDVARSMPELLLYAVEGQETMQHKGREDGGDETVTPQ